jgi:hypothetical protein
MEIDQVLAEAQNQAAFFAALNGEIGKSKEFLTKVRIGIRVLAFWVGFHWPIQATKNKDEWSGPPEEEIYAGSGVGAWMEEA